MSASNQSAHAAAIAAAGGALIQAVNAAVADGLAVDLALRILRSPRSANQAASEVGRLKLSEVFYDLGGNVS